MNPITMKDTVDFIDDRLRRGVFTQHVVVNVAKLVSMRKDNVLRRSVLGCDLINIDGMGVVWGARLAGFYVPERVAGVDLFEHLLRRAAEKGYPVYFLGGRDAVVKEVVRVCKRDYPGLVVAGAHHGYFWEDQDSIVAKIRRSGAKLLFVAISSPKKENFINQWKGRLGVDFVMGVGGTFDVVAGVVRRAPRWMRRSGLEWAYRVLQEPGRMWKRYAVTNTRYVFLLFGEVMRKRFFDKK